MFVTLNGYADARTLIGRREIRSSPDNLLQEPEGQVQFRYTNARPLLLGLLPTGGPVAGGSLVNVSVSGLQPDGVPVCLFGPQDAPIEVGAPCDPLEFLARVVLLNVLLPTR